QMHRRADNRFSGKRFVEPTLQPLFGDALVAPLASAPCAGDEQLAPAAVSEAQQTGHQGSARGKLLKRDVIELFGVNAPPLAALCGIDAPQRELVNVLRVIVRERRHARMRMRGDGSVVRANA